jgi:hypothetical protein
MAEVGRLRLVTSVTDVALGTGARSPAAPLPVSGSLQDDQLRTKGSRFVACAVPASGPSFLTLAIGGLAQVIDGARPRSGLPPRAG